MDTSTFARKLGMGALALGATLMTATLLQVSIVSSANAAGTRGIAASVDSAVAAIDKAPLTAMHSEASAVTAEKSQARG